MVIETARGPYAALVATPARGVTERVPALLVPGYTGSKEDFLAVLDSLAMSGRAITAIDMRGQYQSGPSATAAGYGLGQLAEDLIAVASAVADESGRVHVLGHSFGGLVARQAAIASPGRFVSLTLLGSGPGAIGGQRAAVLRETLEYLRPAGSDTAALRTLVSAFWEQHVLPQAEAEGTPPEIIDFLRARMLLTCPLGLVEMAAHLLDCPDRTSQLAEVPGLPILVSYGENDDAWPPRVQDLMARRLRAERICLPGAAHSPAVEAPETTAAMLSTFWNQAEVGRQDSSRE